MRSPASWKAPTNSPHYYHSVPTKITEPWAGTVAAFSSLFQVTLFLPHRAKESLCKPTSVLAWLTLIYSASGTCFPFKRVTLKKRATEVGVSVNTQLQGRLWEASGESVFLKRLLQDQLLLSWNYSDWHCRVLGGLLSLRGSFLPLSACPTQGWGGPACLSKLPQLAGCTLTQGLVWLFPQDLHP